LGQANFFSPFGRIGEGSASSRQQTALGSHSHQALPPGNTNARSNATNGGASIGNNAGLAIGSSGYNDNGGDTMKSYNPNTGSFGG